jgi:hypothetical protein
MLTRPCDRRVEQTGESDSMRQSTFDGCLDEVGARKASEIVIWTYRLLQASRAAMASIDAVPASISDSHTALQRIEDQIRPATEQAEGRLLAVRVHLTRADALNHLVTVDLRSFSDEIQAAAHRCGEDVWVESLRIEAASPAFT